MGCEEGGIGNERKLKQNHGERIYKSDYPVLHINLYMCTDGRRQQLFTAGYI